MRSRLVGMTAVAVLLAGAALAQNATMPPGSACTAAYTNTTDPAKRGPQNTGAVAVVIEQATAGSLYLKRGPAAFSNPPARLDEFDARYAIQLSPSPGGYTSTYRVDRNGRQFDVSVNLSKQGEVWTIAMLPAVSGAITATGTLACKRM